MCLPNSVKCVGDDRRRKHADLPLNNNNMTRECKWFPTRLQGSRIVQKIYAQGKLACVKGLVYARLIRVGQNANSAIAFDDSSPSGCGHCYFPFVSIWSIQQDMNDSIISHRSQVTVTYKCCWWPSSFAQVLHLDWLPRDFVVNKRTSAGMAAHCTIHSPW